MAEIESRFPKPETDRAQIICALVANYDNLEPIPGVRQDWSSLEQLFFADKDTSIFSPDQVLILKDPTLAELQSALVDYALGRSATGDILLFYFGGHGMIFGEGEFHLCLKDTVIDGSGAVLPLSTIPMKSIIQTIALTNFVPCFILDSCFSGAVVRESEKNIGISLEMQANRTLVDKYAVFASSAENSVSKGTEDGGYFTNAIADTVYEGLQNRDHIPFITLENIVSSVDHHLELVGAPLSRMRIGGGMPELRLAKNRNYNPVDQIERFTSAYKPLLELLWNDGDLRCVTLKELREWDATSYGNHTKFERIWGLVENGRTDDGNRCRKLTQKGIDFVNGDSVIDNEVYKGYGDEDWKPTENSREIRFDDL